MFDLAPRFQFSRCPPLRYGAGLSACQVSRCPVPRFQRPPQNMLVAYLRFMEILYMLQWMCQIRECVYFLKFSGYIHIPWFIQELYIFPDIFREFTHYTWLEPLQSFCVFIQLLLLTFQLLSHQLTDINQLHVNTLRTVQNFTVTIYTM